MPISEGYKSIGPAWASATTKGSGMGDDRIDPDDSSLTPPITVADGWPDSFSDGTNTPRRKVFNELEFRKDSALLDVRNNGILPWDGDVDTLTGGVKQVDGTPYRAIADDTGTRQSPTQTGQTRWETLTPSPAVPDEPDAPTGVATATSIDWSWNCPLDNGAAVTSFDLQWREVGGTFATVSGLSTARYLLTGLTVNTTYEVQVQASNAQGDSGYGNVGMATTVAQVPGGGNTFALRADATDNSGEIELDWLEPANNGAAITQYTYQWKSGSQSYNTTRQGTTTATTATVTGLTDGTDYDFQVYATNSAGDGPVSNEATATPVNPVPPPPPATVPDAPAAVTGVTRPGLVVVWEWDIPPDDGGAMITSYDHQWRYDGNAWSGNTTTGLETLYFSHTVANANNGVQARVRARNSEGAGGWRTSAVVAADALQPTPMQIHEFDSTQTWNWPYDHVDRASVVLTAESSAPTRDMGSDIDLGAGAWTGACVGRHDPLVC